MQDVSPELLNRIRSDFRKSCREDKQLGTVIDRIDSGKGTYREAQELAGSLGDKLGEAYKVNLTAETLPDGRLYRNIAEKVIRPTLHDNYELVSEASQKVQKALNDDAGIGLKVQIPEEDTDRVDGIIDRVSDHVDEFTSETADDLASMTENFTHHVVDAFIEKNADFQYSVGLKPKIERDAMAECCGWCLDLAGTYEYPLKDRSVFQRHKECRCVVDYHPGKGKVQNAHTKQWRDETDSDILEARKTANLEPLVDPAKIEQRKQADAYTKHFRDKYSIELDPALWKLDHESVIQALQGMENILKEFPQAIGYLKLVNTNGGGFLETYYDGHIGCNPRWFNNPIEFVETINNSSGLHRNASIKSCGAHEIGHILEKAIIDKMTNGQATPGGKALWNISSVAQAIVNEGLENAKNTAEGKGFSNSVLRGAISKYANDKKKPSECLAEAVADVYVNGEKAAILSKEIWKILKRELG